ncbi:MAG TPA: GNAT family N-acetyltransferase [Flavipsychrobacter sp.]|nr:GNAT family N-acetyltransferase [Flavipsychrobacter sp.]
MQSGSEYKIVRLGVQEFHLLIPLMKDCFGVDVDIEFFRWKYEQNPAGEVIGFLAVAGNGEIGAYYGVIPERYIVDGEEKIIYQSCDTMTHSGHRRKGLFQLLANHCYDYLKSINKLFIIGFGGDMSTPGFLKFGWQQISNVQQMLYPKWFSALPVGNSEKYRVQEVNDINKLDGLLQKSNSHTQIHSLKNSEIFEWRIKNPLHKYQLYVAVDSDNSAIGYICYYISRNRIYLFDFYSADRQAEKTLLYHIKKKLNKEKNTKWIQTLCSENSYIYSALKKNWFLTSPFKDWQRLSLPIIFFSDQENMQRYGKANLWNFTTFDHDTL